MEIKSLLNFVWKTFGFLYCIINLIFSIAIAFLVFGSIDKSSLDLELLLMLFPFLGVAAGYWIWKSKYNWWRLGVICLSILITFSILFTAIFIAPKLDDLKQKKYQKMQGENISAEALPEAI